MSTLSTNLEFKAYVICCSILSLQMLILGGMTAARRAKVKRFVNPEDSKVAFDKDATVNDGGEHPEVARIQRAHRNMLETLPLFFAMGLAAVLAGASPLGVKVAFGTFTGARILHSIVYLNGVQPWRTIFFAIGALSVVALMVMSILAVVS